jgi:hypothetical protein
MVAVYVPAEREEASTVRVMGSCSPVELPEVGARESHSTPSLAVQFSVPPPTFQISRVWGEGLAWPRVQVKVKLAEAKAIEGKVEMIKSLFDMSQVEESAMLVIFTRQVVEEGSVTVQL